MTIVEIVALENGAHRNVTSEKLVVPNGWAIVPPSLDTPNFPFGNLTVDDQTPPVVLTWEPVDIPAPEEEPSDTE